MSKYNNCLCDFIFLGVAHELELEQEDKKLEDVLKYEVKDGNTGRNDGRTDCAGDAKGN